MSKKTLKTNQVVVKDAFDRLAFDGISEATSLTESVQADRDAVEDTFSSFYKINVATEGKGQRKELVDQMLSLPEYQSLHQSTQLDDVASALAAAHFSQTLIEQLQKIEKKREEQGKDEGASLEDILGEQGMGALRSELRRALEESEEISEDWKDTKAGWGITPGELSDMSGEDRMDLASKLMSDKKLQKLAALFGRFRNIVTAAASQVYSHGTDEIVDITVGNDLSNLLPQELLKLKVNPTQFYREYLEGQLLCYNKRGQEPLGKGPIIVALDISASMAGWREEYARALTMALIQLATKEKRAFSVIFFDARVQDTRVWNKGDPISLQEKLELANRPSNGGGTDFVAPLSKAMEIRSKLNPELKPADLVFITDGDCRLPEEFASEFMFAKKQTDLRVYGLSMGKGYSHNLTFCNQVYEIDNEGQIEEVKDLVRKASQR